MSAIPTLYILLRTSRLKATETKTSRHYYSAGLVMLLVWTFLDFATTNISPGEAALAGLANRLTFMAVSLTVFLYVMSAVHFTHAPRVPEILFFASPILMILIAYVVDPFEQSYTAVGWQADFAYPVVKYAWLSLILLVMVYSYIRLFGIRSKIRDKDAKRRMTYFASSFVLALIVAVLLYLLPQLSNLPVSSSIGVNLSLLLTYPAFLPGRRKSAD